MTPRTRCAPLPRLRGRDREGACNKIHSYKLTPSPTLPRKRGREQTEFAACGDSLPREFGLEPRKLQRTFIVAGRSSLHRRRAVGSEHRASEIERAGDEDARRRRKPEAADRGERGLHVIGALRGNADRARGVRDRVGGKAFLLTGDRHRHDAAGKPSKIPQIALALLWRMQAAPE